MGTLPPLAALISNVRRLWSVALTSAPCSISNSTISTLPWRTEGARGEIGLSYIQRQVASRDASFCHKEVVRRCASACHSCPHLRI